VRRRISQLFFVAALCCVARPAAAIPPIYVTCGDTITANRNAHLIGDCTGSIRVASGRLFLDGFTISGTGLAAIECEGGCRIDGPGTIASSGSTFGVSGNDRIRVTGLTISGHASAGVNSGEVGGIRVADALITDNGVGIRGTRIRVRGSVIRDNVENGITATTRGVNIKESDVLDNGGDGIATVLSDDYGNLVKIVLSHVRGNGNFGIVAKNITVTRAEVRDNSQNLECGDTRPCADVGAVYEPKFFVLACDTSMMIPEEFSGPIPFGPSWGICSGE
jgi:hypothetical protein